MIIPPRFLFCFLDFRYTQNIPVAKGVAMAKRNASHRSSAQKNNSRTVSSFLFFRLLGVVLPIAGYAWIMEYSERVGPTESFPAFGNLLFLTGWFCLVGILWAVGAEVSVHQKFISIL
jgi:hypothetical protein